MSQNETDITATRIVNIVSFCPVISFGKFFVITFADLKGVQT